MSSQLATKGVRYNGEALRDLISETEQLFIKFQGVLFKSTYTLWLEGFLIFC